MRLGLGGAIGSGHQWVSWIALTDVIGALLHCLNQDQLQGPVNVVAPQPVRSRCWIKAIARVLKRPACLPLPTWMVQAIWGELGRETLLASQNVVPTQLLASGYAFRYPSIDSAITACLENF